MIFEMNISSIEDTMKIIRISKSTMHINHLNEIAKLKWNDLQAYEGI
jgi:hypothetical protein